MRYPQIGRTGNQTLAIPSLSGGIDYEKPPERIADTALCYAQNVWWQDGQLQTRPAFQTVGQILEEAPASLTNADILGRKPVSITLSGEEAYAVLVEKIISTSRQQLLVYAFSASGSIRKKWKMEITTADPTGNYARLLPSGSDEYVFLVYARTGAVYYPSEEETASGSGVYKLLPLPEDRLYIPTIFMNGKTLGGSDPNSITPGGTMIEGYSVFTRYFRCYYTTVNPTGNVYQWLKLPAPISAGTGHVQVTYTDNNGTVYTGKANGTNVTGGVEEFNLSDANGSVFAVLRVDYNHQAIRVVYNSGYASYLPTSTFSNNLEVVAYRKIVEGETRPFSNVTVKDGCLFGGSNGSRLFLLLEERSNNNCKVMWSEPGMPLYISENSYAYIGNGGERGTALGVQAEYLTIFKERSIYLLSYKKKEIDADKVIAGTSADGGAPVIGYGRLQLPRHDCALF